MFAKRYILLFLIFISSSVITKSIAQTDTLAINIPIIKVKDSTKTTALVKQNTVEKIKDSIEKEPFKLSVEQSIISQNAWQQPYRFEDKNLKTLVVKIVIKHNTAKTESLDFNQFSLIDELNNLRIRPSGVFYPKRDKKKYLKSKPVNQNYNYFKETTIDGFQNFEAKTYKINFLGLRKKNLLATVKQLKKINIKARKTTYYLDFPVKEGFNYGKIYYKDKPIGFAAVK